MKCLFLYNPQSGKGKIARKLPYIRRRLESQYEVEIYETKSPEDLTEKVKKAEGQYDLIVFSGGDGTFNKVVQAAGKVPLGYLPSGTTNDIAVSLGIPRSVRGALGVILKGRRAALDCLLVNGQYYAMYIVAAGTLTSLTYMTSQRQKRALGWFAYVFHGLKNNLKFEVFPVEGECGEEFSTDCVLILVMNGRSVARFPVNRSASMADGKLEVALVKQAKRPNFFQKIGAFFSVAALMVFGIKIKKRDIEIFRGDHVRIHTSEMLTWDFDGEEGIKGDVEIEVLPAHVNVCVPKRKKV